MSKSKYKTALRLISKSFQRECSEYPDFSSPHEGYGVLMEEVAELFEEIRKKPDKRDRDAMAKEAAQVGAVALKIIANLCLDEPVPFEPTDDQYCNQCRNVTSCNYKQDGDYCEWYAPNEEVDNARR